MSFKSAAKKIGKILIPAGFAACTLLMMAELAQAADAPGDQQKRPSEIKIKK